MERGECAALRARASDRWDNGVISGFTPQNGECKASRSVIYFGDVSRESLTCGRVSGQGYGVLGGGSSGLVVILSRLLLTWIKMSGQR